MHRRKEIDFKDSFGLWYIETKLPITNRVLEIYIPFAVIQEDITLVEKIGTCSRYHPNAMYKITANGWYLGPSLKLKCCQYPIEEMRQYTTNSTLNIIYNIALQEGTALFIKALHYI